MFKDELRSIDQVFSEAHKLMIRGILLFGAFAVILSVPIFLFPAFIGALTATILLLSGLIALVSGYRFWTKGRINKYNTMPFYPDFEFAKIRTHRFRRYRIQTIHFTRW